MSPDTQTKPMSKRIIRIIICAAASLSLALTMALTGAGTAAAKQDEPPPTTVTVHFESARGSYLNAYKSTDCTGSKKKVTRGSSNKTVSKVRSWKAPLADSAYARKARGKKPEKRKKVSAGECIKISGSATSGVNHTVWINEQGSI